MSEGRGQRRIRRLEGHDNEDRPAIVRILFLAKKNGYELDDDLEQLLVNTVVLAMSCHFIPEYNGLDEPLCDLTAIVLGQWSS
jgi:hypothetical protein